MDGRGHAARSFIHEPAAGNVPVQGDRRQLDGVASQAPGLIAFTIEPYFYQRAWFFLAVAGGAGLALWLIWRRRVARITREFRAVLAERARIARDLHDTIVQQLSGVMMQLQALWMRLPASRDKMALGDIIHDAEACANEARSSLWELQVRSSATGIWQTDYLKTAAKADPRETDSAHRRHWRR